MWKSVFRKMGRFSKEKLVRNSVGRCVRGHHLEVSWRPEPYMFQRVRAPSASDVKGGMILMNPLFGCICFFWITRSPQKILQKYRNWAVFSNKVSLAQQKEKSFGFFSLVGNSLRRFLGMWHTLTYAEYRDISSLQGSWMSCHFEVTRQRIVFTFVVC